MGAAQTGADQAAAAQQTEVAPSTIGRSEPDPPMLGLRRRLSIGFSHPGFYLPCGSIPLRGQADRHPRPQAVLHEIPARICRGYRGIQTGGTGEGADIARLLVLA